MTRFAVMVGKGSSDRGKILKLFDNKEDAAAFAVGYRDKRLKKNYVLMLISADFNDKGKWAGGRYNLYDAWTA